MDPTLAATLAALALADSTSFGTLLIPVWLLLAPGPIRVRRVLCYLAVVAGFYLAVGLVLVQVADEVMDLAGASSTQSWLVWAQLAAGVALLALSFWFDRDDRKAKVGARLSAWRARAVGDDSGVSGLVRLALTATTLEVATMLPYVIAIGLLSAAGLGAAATTGVLAAYCVIMVAPALVLMTVRVAAAGVVTRPLARLDAWFVKRAGSATSWLVGILGVLLGADALGRI